jgi:hypothetical protein
MRTLRPQAKLSKKFGEFAGRRHLFYDGGQPLDVSTQSKIGTLLDHDIDKVHIHRGYQTKEVSRRLDDRAFNLKRWALDPSKHVDTATAEELLQTAKRDTKLASSALTWTHSDAGMVLPAPAESKLLNANTRKREGQDRPSVPVPAGELTEAGRESIPYIDVREVANRVYRLMQHELTWERERVTKSGG